MKQARSQVAPLTGHVAAIAGSGPVAAVLKDHLLRLGARVGPPAADCLPPGQAAGAEVHGSRGAAKLFVAWSDLWPGGPVRDEATAQAVCGLMHVHGRRYGCPTVLGAPVVSTAAAILALTGLLASLAGGRRDEHVATGLDRAALQLLGHYIAVAEGVGGPPDTAVGGPPFRSADGVWFELEAMSAEPWAGFWHALGASGEAVRQSWPSFLFRFTTATCPLPGELHRAAQTSSWGRIAAAAAGSGASVCRIHCVAERAAEMGLAQGRQIPDPWAWQPGPEAAIADRHRPEAGETCPLSGFVVLEAGSRIQAPLAAHLLQLLGARVIRVERPGGDPMRGMPPTIGHLSAVWLALNAGKEETVLFCYALLREAKLLSPEDGGPAAVNVNTDGLSVTFTLAPVEAKAKERYREPADAQSRLVCEFARERCGGKAEFKEEDGKRALLVTLKAKI